MFVHVPSLGRLSRRRNMVKTTTMEMASNSKTLEERQMKTQVCIGSGMRHELESKICAKACAKARNTPPRWYTSTKRKTTMLQFMGACNRSGYLPIVTNILLVVIGMFPAVWCQHNNLRLAYASGSLALYTLCKNVGAGCNNCLERLRLATAFHPSSHPASPTLEQSTTVTTLR